MRRVVASCLLMFVTGLSAWPSPAGQAPDLKKQLAEPVTLKGMDGNTPFKDVMEYLGERYKLTFRIDRAAFKKQGLAEVDQAPIRLAEQKHVPLGKVLQRVLDQVKGTYRVKDNEILIVPIQKPKTRL